MFDRCDVCLTNKYEIMYKDTVVICHYCFMKIVPFIHRNLNKNKNFPPRYTLYECIKSMVDRYYTRSVYNYSTGIRFMSEKRREKLYFYLNRLEDV